MSTSFWNDVTVIVPFRMASNRFPNKALVPFCGKPLVQHAIDNARGLEPKRIVVTAPQEDLQTVAQEIDLIAPDILVRPSAVTCTCASERVLELYPTLEGDLFITLPIDEPVLRPEALRKAVTGPEDFGDAEMITFYCDFYEAGDYEIPQSAKVITNRHGMMIWMSRGITPIRKDGTVEISMLKKCVGSYLFQRRFLDTLAAEADVPTHYDRLEGCEQLRWLELGFLVKCLKVDHIGFGIDLPEQLEQLEKRVGC